MDTLKILQENPEIIDDLFTAVAMPDDPTVVEFVAVNYFRISFHLVISWIFSIL